MPHTMFTSPNGELSHLSASQNSNRNSATDTTCAHLNDDREHFHFRVTQSQICLKHCLMKSNEKSPTKLYHLLQGWWWGSPVQCWSSSTTFQWIGTNYLGWLFSPIVVAWLLFNAIIGIYNIAHWHPGDSLTHEPHAVLLPFQSVAMQSALPSFTLILESH